MEDIEKIKQKFKSQSNEEVNFSPNEMKKRVLAAEKDTESTINTIKTDNNDYLWENLQNFKTDPSKLSGNFTKILRMINSYNQSNNKFFKSLELKDKIIFALNWLSEKAYNREFTIINSGYAAQIDIPNIIVNIFLNMDQELDENLKNKYMDTIQKFLPAIDLKNSFHTGANLTDICCIKIKQGALMNNEEIIENAVKCMITVTNNVTTGDGFYPDGSFIQHSRVAYTGSYGCILLNGVADILYLIQDTKWQLDQALKNKIKNWILKSYEPIVFKGYVMDMVRGRAISRYDMTGYMQTSLIISAMIKIAGVVNDKMVTDTCYGLIKYWYEESKFNFASKISPLSIIQKYNDIIKNPNVKLNTRKRNHHAFNCMDKTVHKRENFCFAISRSSIRVSKYEFTNGENKTPWFQGDGMVYLYNNDFNQYSDHFWCTIDFNRLPGTTAVTRPRVPLTGKAPYNESYKMSFSDWSGGAKLGDYGVCGIELLHFIKNTATQSGMNNNHDNLKARKSYFLFDDEMVALGSSITNPDEFKVETVIENRVIKKDASNKFIVNGDSKIEQLGSSEVIENAEWAFLEGNKEEGSDIGYYFPFKQKINVLRVKQTGKWETINSLKNDNNTKVLRENNFLTMFIEHGVRPNNQKYCYVILPNVKSSEQVEEYSKNPNIVIIRNDDKVHSVRNNSLNIEGANFWVDGENKAGIIKSYHRATIICKENDDNTMTVSVSDPTFKQNLISIEIQKTAIKSMTNNKRLKDLKLEENKISFKVDTKDTLGDSIMMVFQL